MIATENLDTANDVLIERDEITNENKKQTFGTEQKNTEEFFPLPKRQTKHSAAIRVGATADLMQWNMTKIYFGRYL